MPAGWGRSGVNAAEWEAAARPLVEDLAAVLAEHCRMEFGPAGLGPELNARLAEEHRGRAEKLLEEVHA